MTQSIPSVYGFPIILTEIISTLQGFTGSSSANQRGNSLKRIKSIIANRISTSTVIYLSIVSSSTTGELLKGHCYDIQAVLIVA